MAFLESGGPAEWLDGLQHAPKKLRDLHTANLLLAHRPWMFDSQHVKVCVCSFFCTFSEPLFSSFPSLLPHSPPLFSLSPLPPSFPSSPPLLAASLIPSPPTEAPQEQLVSERVDPRRLYHGTVPRPRLLHHRHGGRGRVWGHHAAALPLCTGKHGNGQVRVTTGVWVTGGSNFTSHLVPC